METNYSYSSYPESGDSSPRSRDVDPVDNNPASWEDAPPAAVPVAGRVKLMISYGGRIQPRAHDNQLSYLNGETKILSVDRCMRFSDFHSKLASISASEEVCIKYQLPGEDLDALVSVTNDEDLDHMVLEFDRLHLHRSSRGTPRIRVFLFPINRSAETKTERHWFVDALNSVPSLPPPVPVSAPSNGPASPDYLFGLETGFVLPPAVKVKDPTVHDQPVQRENGAAEVAVKEERQIASDLSPPAEIQKEIHELEKLQLSDNQPQPPTLQAPPTMQRTGSDEALARACLPKPHEKPPVPAPAPVQSVQSVQQVQSPPASAVPQPTVTAPPGYMSAAGTHFGSMANGGDHRPVYLIPHGPPGYFTTGGASFVYAMAPPGQTAMGQGGGATLPAGYDGAGRAVYYTSMMPSAYHHQAVTSAAEAPNP